jgi:hypothetical protein
MPPYRQAHHVLQLMLPIGNRHNHVNVRNQTVAVGASVQTEPPLRHVKDEIEFESELGIDVGYMISLFSRTHNCFSSPLGC